MQQVVSDPIKIPSKLLERRWMRAAKAWRCFFELPAESKLAAKLTALIDMNINVVIVGEERCISLCPAYVVDVPGKGSRFQLVLETVYESQKIHGEDLTSLVGSECEIQISPVGEEMPVVKQAEQDQGIPSPEMCRISTLAIQGLHATLFKNPLFWRFLEQKHQACTPIRTAETCKAMFKQYMEVDSCKEVRQMAFDACRSVFSKWVTSGQGA